MSGAQAAIQAQRKVIYGTHPFLWSWVVPSAPGELLWLPSFLYAALACLCRGCSIDSQLSLKKICSKYRCTFDVFLREGSAQSPPTQSRAQGASLFWILCLRHWHHHCKYCHLPDCLLWKFISMSFFNFFLILELLRLYLEWLESEYAAIHSLSPCKTSQNEMSNYP